MNLKSMSAKLTTISLTIFTGFIIFFANTLDAQAKNEYISDEELQKITEEVGTLYDIDPHLLQAICEKESSKNIYAENGECFGLTQISTRWHAGRMEELGVTDLYDPYSNILVCADYLSELYQISEDKGYGRDTSYVLMRYNMKTSTANSLYEQGIVSNYASGICERVEELHAIEEAERLLSLDEDRAVYRGDIEKIIGVSSLNIDHF